MHDVHVVHVPPIPGGDTIGRLFASAMATSSVMIVPSIAVMVSSMLRNSTRFSVMLTFIGSMMRRISAVTFAGMRVNSSRRALMSLFTAAVKGTRLCE